MIPQFGTDGLEENARVPEDQGARVGGGGTLGKKETRAQGPRRVRRQVHNDRKTSGKNDSLRKKKESLS